MKRGFSLRKSAEIKRVRRKGRSQAHPFLALIALPNQGQGLRIAVTAGRDVGGAVVRNRAKRVMRAAIQPLLAQIQSDHDILLLARPGIRAIDSAETQQVISGLLNKAGLLDRK
ncbi:MAG: ribonuclease P protein component [Anaerolineales bacterium]